MSNMSASILGVGVGVVEFQLYISFMASSPGSSPHVKWSDQLRDTPHNTPGDTMRSAIRHGHRGGATSLADYAIAMMNFPLRCEITTPAIENVVMNLVESCHSACKISGRDLEAKTVISKQHLCDIYLNSIPDLRWRVFEN